MRTIDVDEAIEVLDKAFPNDNEGIRMFKDFLRSSPTVAKSDDIVHCIECTYYNEELGVCNYPRYVDVQTVIKGIKMLPEDFCSRGDESK